MSNDVYEPYMDECFDCKHFENAEPNSARSDCWYNHLCKNFEITEEQIGGMITRYGYCRDIFGANCQTLPNGTPRFSPHEGPCYLFEEEPEEILDRSEILDF